MAYLNGEEVLFSPKVLLGGSNGSAETVIEQNNETSLRFWVGSQAEYDAIETKDENCFYIISDDGDKDEIYQRLENLEKADYVVEQGTDGIWTYRKWNSGISECWMNLPHEMHDISVAYENYGYYCINTGYDFPRNLFIDTPFVNYFVENDNGVNGLSWGRGTAKACKSLTTKDNTGILYIDFPSKVYPREDWTGTPIGTDTKYTFPEGQYLPCHFSIEAKGRWK